MLHPTGNQDLARRWSSLAKLAGEAWSTTVHESCLHGQRESRLAVLDLSRHSYSEWFGVITAIEKPSSVERSLDILRLAQDCLHESNFHKDQLAIVPAGGEWQLPGNCLFAPEDAPLPAGKFRVDSTIAENQEARTILTKDFGIRAIDDDSWKGSLSDLLKKHRWGEFWSTFKASPESVQRQFLESHGKSLHVRCLDQEWHASERALLSGQIATAEENDPNRGFCLDTKFHGTDPKIHELLGVEEKPTGTQTYSKSSDSETLANTLSSTVLAPWLDHWRNTYKQMCSNSATWNYLEIRGRTLSMPRGWLLLTKLEKKGKAVFTVHLLHQMMEKPPDPVDFGHCTMYSYPGIEATHPIYWFLLQHGTLEVGEKFLSLRLLVARLDLPSVGKVLEGLSVKPALEHLKRQPNPITPEPSPESLRKMWWALFSHAERGNEILDEDDRTALWEEAAQDQVVPEQVKWGNHNVPLQEVFVTSAEAKALAKRLRGRDFPAFSLNEHAKELWLQNGAKNLADHLKPSWSGDLGPTILLVEPMPELSEVLDSSKIHEANFHQAKELVLCFGERTEATPCLFWDGDLLLDLEALSDMPRADRLRYLLAEIHVAGWLQGPIDRALNELFDANVDARRVVVREKATLPERLAEAVGNRKEPLLQAIDRSVALRVRLDERPILECAQLALALIGPPILQKLSGDLKDEGLNPPSRWGTVAAQAFVEAIGFPLAFASASETPRESEAWISGPIILKDLHPYQKRVMDGLKEVLSASVGSRRCVVSLPTGGGKTRVTVQAAVELVLKSNSKQRSILWVAQTDELCEQAVQTFRQVWLNLGAIGTDLRIVRLWGGNPNPVPQDPDGALVVVATINTLNSRCKGGSLDWLRELGLVVVDECHHAIARSYTDLIKWINHGEADSARREPPIIGLSATPFRVDDGESQRLAKRFNNRWLPTDQESLYNELLNGGQLAKTKHQELGSKAELTPEEIAALENIQGQWEGFEFEKILERINRRLAMDRNRNRLLIDTIARSHETSILFFTNSVTHAEVMSAHLNLQGIPAAAISGDTPTSARRWFIDAFQKKNLRVLCNHSVLTTGFDAPDTDMVLISRQVFSPVRYMQMVGRGLRGPENGGSSHCRIVTVRDNLHQFANRHPFDYCRQYFGS
jgi:superfamily II DNA or RNA helicase